MTGHIKSHFTVIAAIGLGKGKTIFPDVKLFFPDVSVRITEPKVR